MHVIRNTEEIRKFIGEKKTASPLLFLGKSTPTIRAINDNHF